MHMVIIDFLSIGSACSRSVRLCYKNGPFVNSGQAEERIPLAPAHDELGRAAAGFVMCNDFGNRIPYDDYLAAFSQIRMPVRWPKAAPNLEPPNDIWPTDTAPVIRQPKRATNSHRCAGAFRPRSPRAAGDQFSFRTAAISKGALPRASLAFFEFTGSKSPKTKWKFTKAGEEWFCFAGLWRPMPDPT